MANMSSLALIHNNAIQSTMSFNASIKRSECVIEDGFISTVLPVLYTIICVIGLLSNIPAFWVFYFNQNKATSISTYMRHLALSDLLLLLCLPFRITYHIGEYTWMAKFYFCKIIGSFFYINMYVSIAFLELISLDRYLKITKPLRKFRIHSEKWSSSISMAVWVVVFLLMLPFVVLSTLHSKQAKCFHYTSQKFTAGSMNLTAVISIFIFSLLFLIFYAKIAVKLYEISQGKKDHIRKVRTRAILKTFIVLVIFLVCFVPYHIIRIPYVLSQMDIISSCQMKHFLHVANELALCLSALNSCLNPIIYFFLSNSFRKTIIYNVHGKFHKNFTKTKGATNSFKSITEI
ncbi:G protein-coupled receptor 34 like [Narcine bancroftii]|uniref:G protein-coupled receptor 34 like n=1 Tax=Narcine bancroftii TaxID=1343680 RepID=UPI0038317800